MTKEEKKDKQKPKKKEKEDPKKSIEEYSPESIRLLYDFEYNALRETAMVLAKGITYYITIFLGILGYIFTQEVSVNIKSIAVAAIILISVAILFSALYIVWGLLEGLKSLKKLTELSDKKLFENANVGAFFKRGQLVIKGVIFSCIFVLVVLVCAIVSLLPVYLLKMFLLTLHLF